MLWSHKHKYCKDCIVRDILQLHGLNMIIYGPPGGSKRFYVDEYIRKTININFEDWSCNVYHINAEKKVEINLFIRQSRLHIECYLDEFGNYHKYFVKHIIKPIVSNLTITTDGHVCSKLIVIYNIHYLSNSNQQELRKLVEKYTSTASFIFVTDKLSSVINQLTSSLVLYRISRPTTKELKSFIKDILLKEETVISVKNINQQIEKNENHIMNTLNSLQFIKKDFDNIDDTLLILCHNIKIFDFHAIRVNLYMLMINNTPYNTIIKFVVLYFKSFQITTYAAIYSHRLECCERVIYHLEAFTNECVRIMMLSPNESSIGTKDEK
jgi:DNA polymerase III delta prime subunit